MIAVYFSTALCLLLALASTLRFSLWTARREGLSATTLPMRSVLHGCKRAHATMVGAWAAVAHFFILLLVLSR